MGGALTCGRSPSGAVGSGEDIAKRHQRGGKEEVSYARKDVGRESSDCWARWGSRTLIGPVLLWSVPREDGWPRRDLRAARHSQTRRLGLGRSLTPHSPAGRRRANVEC